MQCLKMPGADSQDTEGTASVHNPLARKFQCPEGVWAADESEFQHTE